ncbi:MAG: hypothetical protein LBU88_01125 [Treponema sp.]|nr:hypothetical protein [Treponema sp.]
MIKNNSALCVFFISFLISCQSVPKQFDALLQDTHIPLDTGASVYLFVNVKQSRSIIDLLPIEELQDTHTKQMLDRTDFAAAALFPSESGRHFQLAAWGKYPNSRASMALGANRYWDKQSNSAGKTYWYARSAGLSIAMTSRQAFAVSSVSRGQPIDPYAASPGAEIPEGFNDFAGGVPLSCWINNPAPFISGILSNAGIPLRFPVQQLFINLYPAGEGKYEALIRLIFETATQARGASTVLALASGFAPADFELALILLANPPVQNGRNIDIKTARLSEDDIKVLLGIFI